VGAVANAASGGTLEQLGGWLGRKVYDWTTPAYNPNAPRMIRDPQTLRQGAANTDALWGPLGGVELRAN